MKGSIIVVLFFAFGCFIGWLGGGVSEVSVEVASGVVSEVPEGATLLSAPGVESPNEIFENVHSGDGISNSGWLPAFLVDGALTTFVLYFLMLQVGLSIGADKKLKEIFLSIKPKYLLIPLGTIIGTLTFSALAALFLSKWNVFDCLAVGSGFAYYSLSSILITELKAASIGEAMAIELATIALMANIMREVIALLCTPLLCKYFGRFAPISVGGATTMDTTLPIITKYCGKDLVFIAIFHGVLIDLTVPMFVSLFCSI